MDYLLMCGGILGSLNYIILNHNFIINILQKISESQTLLLGDRDNGIFKSYSIFFLPHDVQSIQEIPFCQASSPDIWIWHHTESGQFTVASAYRLAKEGHSRQTPSNSQHQYGFQLKALWNLRVSPYGATEPFLRELNCP